MREILFRGKSMINRGWVYGSVILWDDGSCSIEQGSMEQPMVAVERNSIGQSTSLRDKNGGRIFEGDIVKVQDDILGSPYCDGIIGKVVYDEAAFFIEPREKENSLLLFNECAVYEIIGNIHDNQEFLGD